MAINISRNQVAEMIYESALYLLAVWSESTDFEIERLNYVEYESRFDELIKSRAPKFAFIKLHHQFFPSIPDRAWCAQIDSIKHETIEIGKNEYGGYYI